MNNFYYTYKITLLKGNLAGHYYYGKHSTKNLNDGYAGSGKIVKSYYKKYGKIEHQTYIKEIIAFYNNDEELNQAEKDLIGDKYNTDSLCLNLVSGGGYSEETKEKIGKSNKGRKFSDEIKKKISERTKEAMNNHIIKQKCAENARKTLNFKGHHHTEETRKKISDIKKGNKNRLGIGFSDESKNKISSSLKKFYKTHKRKYNKDGSYVYIPIEVQEDE